MTASPFMQRALEAARAVRGTTSPNPWVGSVAVRGTEIVAVGATSPPGGPHAEAAAIGAAGGLVDTLYVTLEPCAAFPGKRTPPCSDAIIAAGIRRVVVAVEDPDPGVRGAGIASLRAAGIDVEVGDGRDDALELLAPYIHHRHTGRPYVIAKFAASLDGHTATSTGDSRWITGELARDRGHRERAWVDAVMVGSGTVLADDPALTARPGGEEAARQPVRVVLDSRGRTPPTARVLHGPGHAIIATTAAAPAAWRHEIAATGAHVVDCESAPAGLNLDQLLTALGARGIMSIWAEGGPTLLGSLFDGGHANELWAFIAPIIIGGPSGAAVGGQGARFVAEAWRLRAPEVERLGEDLLVRGPCGEWSPYNRHSS
ncbi:MAG: bifunctional diaminohydroxyphosphoribosylaminopyrimidine deaminase/5-amino-6-(5-phosphoribosylamino)uracil reductase RibD [Dehalococcoidia bacterium]